ncbi:MAG TPA: sigma-70 family RNA polymerase sigma factor, partial [Planctomycetota bacterium]|nr:sigma-70 family RNA polymerase sigma factor [Planctomycetota bacterium]
PQTGMREARDDDDRPGFEATLTPPPLDLAAHVARHAAGLRQLALELVGDAGADDAVQQTWLAAMRHPPRHDASIGGWLATTLRNVVRGSRRQQRRREQREQVAATGRAEAGEDHASLLARGEVAQRLIAAVLALDPVYGETIWQRFFDDRTPRAIAAASGVPVGTVKSRLKRGLAMLRERLSEREGADWRGGFAAAFGLRAAATGVVIMATWTKVAVGGAVAAALLAAVWWWPASADVGPGGASPGGAPVPLAAGADTRTGEVVRDAAVQNTQPAVAAAPAPPAAGVARCRGRVIDAATKAPLAGATVILQRAFAAQAEPTEASFVTRDDGTFVFDFASDGEPPVGLWFRGPEHLLAVSEVSALAAGQDDDVGDIALVRGRRLSGRITDEQGVPLPRGTRLLATFATRNSRAGMREHPTFYVAVGDDGAFTFEPAVPLGPVEFELVRGEHELRERIVVTANEPATLVFVARRRASIRGVVVDGAGSPLAGVRVDLWPRDDPQITAGDGTFTLLRPNDVRAATSKVRVFHAPEFLVYTKDVAWGTADLRIVLTRTAVVPIEVIDDAGTPVQQFGVVLQREGTGATRPGTVLQRGVHEGGRLDVEGVDPGHTSLRVVPVDPQLSPSAYVEIATNEPQRFVLVRRVPCQVEVRLGGQPVAGAQVEILFGGPEGVRDHTIADAVEPHRGECAWILGGPPERIAAARTDANGVASLLRDAAPGRCVLHVRAGGHPPFVVQDPVFPARVELPGVGAIAGRVELRGRNRRDAGVAIRGSTNCVVWPQPDGTFRSP